MNEARMYPNRKDVVKQEYLTFWSQNPFTCQDAKEFFFLNVGSVIFFTLEIKAEKSLKQKNTQGHISVSHQSNDITTCPVAAGEFHCRFVKE